MEAERLVSSGGRSQLRSLGDGQFLIEDVVTGRAIYAFPLVQPLANPPAVSSFSYGSDGNVCVYTKTGKIYCATNGNDALAPVILNKSKYLELTDAGRLTLFTEEGRELWSTPKYPQLMPVGAEGARKHEEIATRDTITIRVVGVEFADELHATTKHPHEIWFGLTEGNRLIQEYVKHGSSPISDRVGIVGEWLRLPGKVDSYVNNGSWDYSKYIKDTHTLVAAKKSNKGLDKNAILVIVPPPSRPSLNKPWAPTSSAHPSAGVYPDPTQNPTGAVYTVVVGFGEYSVENEQPAGSEKLVPVPAPNAANAKKVITLKDDYRLMMHEIGHCFGSGDLYPISQPYIHEVGGFGIMGDMRGATGFLGWQRYRYGWLPAERTLLLDQKGKRSFDLTKLSGQQGVSMIAVRDPKKYDKVWVVEVSQNIVKKGAAEKINTEGDSVIIYTVEGQPPEGKRDVRIVPRSTPADPLAHLTKDWVTAYSFQAGTKFTQADAPFTLDVKQKTANGFKIDIELPKDAPIDSYPKPVLNAVSDNGKFVLKFGSDGNVKVTQIDDTWVWDVKTKLFAGQPTSGNFVALTNVGIQLIDRETGKALATEAVARPARFKVTDDGKLVVVNDANEPVWQNP